MRKFIVTSCLTLSLLGILGLFWRNEWVYNQPTPVPASYHPIGFGTTLDLGGYLKPSGKPQFLHFFNPDCPCSRFNMTYFKTLVAQYGSRVDFTIVVMNNDRYTEKDILDKYDLHIPVLFDSLVAVRCGVYSTPQAVIVDPAHKLYYRGNYNRSRYCTDTKTNYAQMALDGLLQRRDYLRFDQFALTAYGCRLPNCQK